MRTLFLIVIFLFCILLARHAEALERSDKAFASYLNAIPNPELFFHNQEAFNARLKLLDSAPAGSKALIATFLFENGEAVKLLTRHICLASERGVQIQILIDSKSGGRPGIADTFDKSKDAQTVEDLYQTMANCGVRVLVHNQLSSFIEVLGKRIPNIFLDPSLNGKRFIFLDALTVKSRLDELLLKMEDLVVQEARSSGIKADPRSVIKNLKAMLMEGMSLASLTEHSNGYDLEPPAGYHESVQKMERLYRRLLNDPFWSQVSSYEFRSFLPGLERRFKADPEFGKLWQEIRRFNRLNHRKLFLVENGSKGCLLMGGRNLGDHYLTSKKGSFLDGDLLLCRHHSKDAASVFDQAKNAFTELVQDRSDPRMLPQNDVDTIEIPPNPSFTYRYLKPANLPAPISWADSFPASGGIPLSGANGWRYLKSGWDPQKDEVQLELLKRIDAERKEVFIETPYGEFDATLRNTIERALQRGVQVHLITNSFFISDGFSKLIRITMANWIEKTQAAYPKHFAVRYVTYEAGHMTHFKGAAFACQKNKDGKLVQSFLIGSHNFDPRSGLADKDHALIWNEDKLGCQSLELSTLVRARYAAYQDLTSETRVSSLANYPDFRLELETVGGKYERKSGASRWMAQALLNIFYVRTASGYKVNQPESQRRFLEFFDDSGLHDFLGRLL